MIVLVKDLQPGTVARWSEQDPWVTVLKIKADRAGHDVLYSHGGSEPRWRGFDDGDKVEKRESA